MAKLKAKVYQEDKEYIHLKIKKDDFEAFCSVTGLFRNSFLDTLKKSEKDLAEGRFKDRDSLDKLISK